MKRRFFHFFLLFLAGAILYPLLELFFRGYTHLSMSILGGIALVFIAFVDKFGRNQPIFAKAFYSAVIITQLELICGIIVNHKMELRVWDYSHLPFQFAGQICLLFSCIWFLLSFFVLSLFRILKKKDKKISTHLSAGN